MPRPVKRHWRRPLFLVAEKMGSDSREYMSACGHVTEDTPGAHFVDDRQNATCRTCRAAKTWTERVAANAERRARTERQRRAYKAAVDRLVAAHPEEFLTYYEAEAGLLALEAFDR